jgi:hypothetical protein
VNQPRHRSPRGGGAPIPQVRLQWLEAWAQHPGETLDVVTYALVDSDESVRDRAQVLFEQALARR